MAAVDKVEGEVDLSTFALLSALRPSSITPARLPLHVRWDDAIPCPIYIASSYILII
jgi:hypothetical protein